METLRTRRVRAIAMSVLASGAIPPREAIEWVAAQESIAAIVFGASSRKNIRDTKSIVDSFYQRPAAVVRAPGRARGAARAIPRSGLINLPIWKLRQLTRHRVDCHGIRQGKLVNRGAPQV